MEEVGVILLLGLLVAPTVLAMVWTVDMAWPEPESKAVRYCDKHPMSEPYCRDGRPVASLDRPDHWCGPLLVGPAPALPGAPLACVEVSVAILVRPLPSPSP